MLLDDLMDAGFVVDRKADGRLFALMEASTAFDAETSIQIIEDIYAQPDKKAEVCAILEQSLKKQAALDRKHPALAAGRKARAKRRWQAVCRHFRERGGSKPST